jgi:hypothetical protein
VDRLQVAMGKVGSKLEHALNVLRLLGLETSSFDLHRHSQDVLSAGSDDLLDLS